MRWACSPGRGTRLGGHAFSGGMLLGLLLCACGNLSNEDIAFLEAIPQKQLLHVEVPQGSAAQTLCATTTAGPGGPSTTRTTPA